MEIPQSLKQRATNLTVRCGDDQLAYAPSHVCRRFEELLQDSGCILSPGQHIGSERFLHFCKCTYVYEETEKGPQISYVDLLRMKQLAGPESRLPRVKEVNPTFSRGVALSSELRWWWKRGCQRAFQSSLFAITMHWEFI